MNKSIFGLSCLVFIMVISVNCDQSHPKNSSRKKSTWEDTSRLAHLLDSARQLQDQGKFKEALAEHIWFHNHALEIDSEWNGVRLSFALSDWKKLGDQFPIAIDSMKFIRDRKTIQVLNEKGKSRIIGDVIALNRTLKEDEKTTQLFETLLTIKDTNEIYTPDVAIGFFLKKENYDLLRQLAVDPMEYYKRTETIYFKSLNDLEDLESDDNKDFFQRSHHESFKITCEDLKKYAKFLGNDSLSNFISERYKRVSEKVKEKSEI